MGIQVAQNLYIFLSGNIYIFDRSAIQLVLIILVPAYCVTIAVMTFRVWQIDVLMSRTLVTFSLTAVLLAIGIKLRVQRERGWYFPGS